MATQTSGSRRTSRSRVRPNDPDRLLTLSEVSLLLGVPVKTLRNWRSAGTGPRSIKVGKHIRYTRDDVRVWVRERQASADLEQIDPDAKGVA